LQKIRATRAQGSDGDETRIGSFGNKRRASLDGHASLASEALFITHTFKNTERKYRENTQDWCRHEGVAQFEGNSLMALGRMMMSSSDTQPRLKEFAPYPQPNQDGSAGRDSVLLFVCCGDDLEQSRHARSIGSEKQVVQRAIFSE
jgi:hypothetical protein